MNIEIYTATNIPRQLLPSVVKIIIPIVQMVNRTASFIYTHRRISSFMYVQQYVCMFWKTNKKRGKKMFEFVVQTEFDMTFQLNWKRSPMISVPNTIKYRRNRLLPASVVIVAYSRSTRHVFHPDAFDNETKKKSTKLDILLRSNHSELNTVNIQRATLSLSSTAQKKNNLKKQKFRAKYTKEFAGSLNATIASPLLQSVTTLVIYFFHFLVNRVTPEVFEVVIFIFIHLSSLFRNWRKKREKKLKQNDK